MGKFQNMWLVRVSFGVHLQGCPASCWTPRGSKPSSSVQMTWPSWLSGASSLRCTLPNRRVLFQTQLFGLKTNSGMFIYVYRVKNPKHYLSMSLQSNPAKAALDYKHINDRFHKGKSIVDQFMSEKHQLVRVPSLVLAHASIVQLQAKMGTNAFLTWIQWIL